MNILIQTHYTQNLLHVVNGGLELHINQLLQGDNKNNYYIFMPNENKSQYVLLTVKNQKILKREYWNYKPSTSDIEVTSPQYIKLVNEILVNYKINTVHIHNCIGHTFDTPTVAQKLKIPVIKSVHDMYDISGEVFKSNYQIRFNEEMLIKEYSIVNFEEWKNNWAEKTNEFYENLTLVIFFSQSTQDIFSKYFPIPNSVIIEHGIEFKKDFIPLGKNTNNYVYIGRVSKEKGVEKLITTFKNRKNEKLFLFGPIESNQAYLIADLPDNIIYSGIKKHDELIVELSNLAPKATFILANWPETFNYVLSEMIQLGIYPIVTDQGALAERVLNNKFGKVIGANFSTEELEQVIDSLRYDEMYQRWPEVPQLPVVDEMVIEYASIYQKYNKLNEHDKITKTNIKGLQLIKTKFKYLLVRNFINTKLWKKYIRPIAKK
jgi:glycosyltransferase involved in cell wall biosynthesis